VEKRLATEEADVANTALVEDVQSAMELICVNPP